MLVKFQRARLPINVSFVVAGKFDGMNPAVNVPPVIRAALLFVLFLAKVFAARRCQVAESLFAVRPGRAGLVREFVGFEALVGKLD